MRRIRLAVVLAAAAGAATAAATAAEPSAGAASAPVAAAPPVAATVRTTPHEAELRRLADEWDQALMRKDRRAILAGMARDFIQVQGDGTVIGAQAFVDDIVDPLYQPDPYTVQELVVREFGDMAQLVGLIRLTGRYDGRPFDQTFRYIDTYLREDGRWKAVSVQVTRLSDAVVRQRGASASGPAASAASATGR